MSASEHNKPAADTAVLVDKTVQRNHFLSHLTHDMRSLVGGLEGVLTLLDIQNQDNTCQELIDSARSSARRLALVLFNILETARVESGNMHLNQISFTPLVLVEELIPVYRKTAENKGITFSVKYDEELNETMHGDPVLLSRVLHNLLDNAVRYTDSGSVNLIARCLPGETAHVQFVVEDTAGGMPEELQENMFTAYSNDYDCAGAGSRLGLPLASMLASLMGGSLTYEKNHAIGSRFILEIPLADSPVEPSELLQQAEPVSFTGKRVLLVEDIKENVKVMLQLLSALGVEAESATSAEQAIALCKDNYYDLVLMDCQMPVMDGFEATRQIHSLQVERDSVVGNIVALTGIDAPGAEKLACEAGMDAYYLKPVSLGLLSTILRKHLE